MNCAQAGAKVRLPAMPADEYITHNGTDLVDQSGTHYDMSTADWADTTWERYEAVMNDFDWAIGKWAVSEVACRKGWAVGLSSGSPIGSITVADKDATDWL